MSEERPASRELGCSTYIFFVMILFVLFQVAAKFNDLEGRVKVLEGKSMTKEKPG